MIVSEFCDNKIGNFSDIFYDSLPRFCPDCEYPMEMTEAITQVHCSNPRCPSKVVQRMLAMASSLGVKDLGESKAYKFLENFGTSNPLLIFAYESAVDGVLGEGISLEVSKKIEDQFQAKKSFTLAEFVRIANLPNIQTSATQLFGDFDDLEEAYKAIEDGGVEYIAKKLGVGISEGEISIRATKVFESLMTFKEDLFQGIKYVTIIKTHTDDMLSLKAVCSDEVGKPFRTKADFYATINNMYSNVHVEFLGAVTKSIDYLVWAGADGSPARLTNKVKKTQAYNEKGCNIPIVTAMQFIEILKEKVGDNA